MLQCRFGKAVACRGWFCRAEMTSPFLITTSPNHPHLKNKKSGCPAEMHYSMAIVPGWLPPTRENYDTILFFWQFGYPLIASAQWVVKWAPIGKTSTPSIFNIPGRVAWMTMELFGPLTLVYVMRALSSNGVWDLLPWQNKVLGGLYLLHYAYRALLYPLLQPSMAPIHIFVWLCAVLFQLCNATCLAAYLSFDDSSPPSASQFAAGLLLFYVGLAGNFFHDEELRQIRRGPGALAPGRYRIPTGGLFRVVLYPHYLCEWIEWFGFWVAAGWGCVPARVFLQNEVFSMLPRAVNGRGWYVERFGEEKLRGRKAILPGLL